jgi:peptidoglycan/xylan/chitin deacetylase (PgdA/CDA1 family)
MTQPHAAETGGRLRSIYLQAALAGRAVLERGDQLLARRAPVDKPGLLIFIMHSLFADRAEIERGLLDPHERATPEGISRLLDYFRGHGYRFVAAHEIDAGLAPGGLYAHLTFDDGFANNLQLIDLLEREDAFATVFPSIEHVRNQQSFWWNSLYRERNRRGQLHKVASETAALRRMTDVEASNYLRAEFGPAAMEPAGDLDRPLSVAELRELAASPRVEIGNHTLDHAVLPNYSPEDAEEQIAGSQRWLERELGATPFFIAYPNGSVNDAVVAMAERQGLRLGVTVAAGLNRLPSSPAERMRLSRFRVVFDDRASQRMRAVRSRIQLTPFARKLAIRT